MGHCLEWVSAGEGMALRREEMGEEIKKQLGGGSEQVIGKPLFRYRPFQALERTNV